MVASQVNTVPLERDKRGVDLHLIVSRVIASNDVAEVFQNVPALASVSVQEYLQYKALLKEHFGRRLVIKDMETAVRSVRKSRKRASLVKQAKDNLQDASARPTIEIGGQLRDTVAQSITALERLNSVSPTIFVQSGKLVTIHHSEKYGPSIASLSLSGLRYKMSLAADYITIRATSEDVISIPVDPPLDVVHVILEGLNPIDYPFPLLEGITELPIVRQDGSIYAVEGYDQITQQMYIPGQLMIAPVPAIPTRADIQHSLDVLLYWLSGFPFADNASRATILADVITVVIRPIIEGQVPMSLLDAPRQGSGKTILGQGIGIIATGRIPSTNPPTVNEEEWVKQILTWLLTSPSVIIIDNVFHQLESSALSTALTTPYHSGRALGGNDYITVPNRAVWFASGNNIRVGTDLTRRCIKCRLDARLERPWKRKDFKISGGANGFFKWTTEHRAELVHAALVLTRNWYAHGKPPPDVTPLGNFEEWTTIIGGILQAAGVPDFLANLDGEQEDSPIDDISAEWAAFIEAIYTLYSDMPFACTQLAGQMLLEDEDAINLRETLPQSMAKNFDSYRRSGGKDTDFPVHVGSALRNRKGQIYGGLRIDRAGKNRANRVQWQVTKIEPETASVSETEVF